MRNALVMATLLATLGCGFAAEIRVVPVMDSDGKADVNFPQDVACVALSTEIVHVPSKGQAQILTADPFAMIDSDRSSGFTLKGEKEMTFRISLRAIRRVHMVTITVGSPEGTTMSLQTSPEFITGEGERTWEPALENVALKSPACSFKFRPRSATEILVTFKQPAMSLSLKPIIYDISLFSQQDVREFTLAPNQGGEGQPAIMPPSSDFQTGEARNERGGDQTDDSSEVCERQLDLGRMSSGARVFHVSTAADQETADNMNDDDASTYCTFDSSKCDPVIIMDLGARRRVRKTSMVVQSQGEMSAYVTNELPWNTAQERSAEKRVQLTWLPAEMVAAMGGFLCDVTALFAQAPSVGGGSSQGIQISPSWFSGLKKIGGSRVEGLSFMRMKGPVNEGRYMVFHFSPAAATPPLRVYDINVFGDYAPGAFVYALRAPVNSPDAFLRPDSKTGAVPAAGGTPPQGANPSTPEWKDVTKPKPIPAPPPPAS